MISCGKGEQSTPVDSSSQPLHSCCRRTSVLYFYPITVRQKLPHSTLIGKVKVHQILTTYPSDLWRNGRKFMHHVTNTNIANTYQPNQSVESLRMLRDLIRDPARYEHWFNRYSAGIIYRLAYGKAVFTGEEQVVQDIEGIVSRLAKVSRPGAYLVDRFPILMRLPAAIAPFKRELEGLHQRELKVFRQLMADVRVEMERGEAAKSWERDMIEQQAKFHLSDDEGAYLVGTLFEAGAGTTSVAMQTWLLCVVHHPEWFRKMQEEVDVVCGGASRLPTLEDMPQLPVTRAVLKEAMRWQPVFPGGVPHVSVKDDTYEGMFIPAGTIVHASNWAIHHDAQLYPDPEHFRPERWLDPQFPTYREPLTTYPNLHNYSSFGFGRRICPGQNIAERSLDLLTARVAWSCDIARARDESGKEVLPALDRFTDDLVSRPLEFPFLLKAREQARVDLIEAEHKRGEENDPIKVFE